jgi:hypothetical protein
LVLFTAMSLAACGADSTSGPFSRSDAGDAGNSAGHTATGGRASSTGGVAGNGAGGTSSGTGGVASTGGVAATGGAAATGGVGGSPPGDCAPPVNKNQTALCVTLVPEAIKAESDPALDEKGVLLIQIFDTPTPPETNASAVALVERVLPANPGTSEVALGAIPMQRLAGTMPPVAYVRAVFVDDAERLAQGATLGWGAWVGGVDLSDGFQDKDPILPVKLAIGEGNLLSLPLVALRKLTVKVHASATPVGDGQGPLAAVVVNDPDVAKKPPAFGLARAGCADVSKDVTLTGFVVGKGPYWVTGALNDLGLSGDLPPGSLAALDVTASKLTIPRELTFAADDYAPSASIDLSYAVPFPADAGPIPPNSCADLARADGGLLDSGI